MTNKRDEYFMLFGLKPEEGSLRGLGLLAALFFGALLFAALAAPPVHWLAKAWADAYPCGPSLFLAKQKLPVFFDRLRWLPIVAGLPWLLKACGLWSWQRMGYKTDAPWLGAFLKWFAAGMAMIALVAAAQLLALPSSWRVGMDAANFFPAFALAITIGILVGLLEETVFRGLVLRIFYTAARPWIAVLLSALFFALVHFKKIPAWNNAAGDGLWSGFYCAWATLYSVVLTFNLCLFLNLFMTGIVLNLLFLKTRSLVPCVGLHAGWVCLIKIYGNLAHVQPDASRWWWGSERVTDGLFPAALMLLFAAGLLFSSKRNEASPKSAQNG
jgi:membrane protease YdiL (CAAX protease family)